MGHNDYVIKVTISHHATLELFVSGILNDLQVDITQNIFSALSFEDEMIANELCSLLNAHTPQLTFEVMEVPE